MLHTQTTQPKKWTAYLMTYGLWLGTAILAVYEAALASDLVISAYSRFIELTNRNAQVRSHFEAVTLAQIATITMAIIAIAAEFIYPFSGNMAILAVKTFVVHLKSPLCFIVGKSTFPGIVVAFTAVILFVALIAHVMDFFLRFGIVYR